MVISVRYRTFVGVQFDRCTSDTQKYAVIIKNNRQLFESRVLVFEMLQDS